MCYLLSETKMLEKYYAEFFALAIIHFLAVIIPGPDFAVTVSQSVRFGRKLGIYTALGIGAGISVHVLYTLLGISALMHTMPQLMFIIKIIGVAYILYLASSLLRAKRASFQKDILEKNIINQSERKAFSIGFFTNATNPKATLFFLAIFTTIVSEKTPLKIQALYGVWMCIVNAAWFILVSVFFSSAKVRETFLSFGHWFERLMGVILIAFAIKLLFSL